MKIFIKLSVAMLIIFSLLFMLGEHLGYSTPEYVQWKLNNLLRSQQGKVLVALSLIGLLIIDIVLPIPSSIVMIVSGTVFGPILGTTISFIGAMLAAVIAFYSCRLGGQKACLRMIQEKEMARIGDWFNKYGVYAIIISRPIPMLTEILSCLAGLSSVSSRVFFLASSLGTLPVCALYGYFGATSPWLAILAATAIPALGWFFVHMIRKES